MSDEQDFDAVAGRETIESDAERRAAMQAERLVVQPTAVPARPAELGANVVDFAPSTSPLPGGEAPRYQRRPIPRTGTSATAGLSRWRPTLAQEMVPAERRTGPRPAGGRSTPIGGRLRLRLGPHGLPRRRGGRAQLKPFANFGPRRDGLRPELVVLHYTAMADCDAALRVLCTPEREVSAHYLIRRDGEVIALVDEAMRAWHAGAGEWRGRGDVNSRSIGIELDNDGASPFRGPLMDALGRAPAGDPRTLVHFARGRDRPFLHGAGPQDRPPGPRFDWQRAGAARASPSGQTGLAARSR